MLERTRWGLLVGLCIKALSFSLFYFMRVPRRKGKTLKMHLLLFALCGHAPSKTSVLHATVLQVLLRFAIEKALHKWGLINLVKYLHFKMMCVDDNLTRSFSKRKFSFYFYFFVFRFFGIVLVVLWELVGLAIQKEFEVIFGN